MEWIDCPHPSPIQDPQTKWKPLPINVLHMKQTHPRFH
jgi:hypothetical protein